MPTETESFAANVRAAPCPYCAEPVEADRDTCASCGKALPPVPHLEPEKSRWAWFVNPFNDGLLTSITGLGLVVFFTFGHTMIPASETVIRKFFFLASAGSGGLLMNGAITMWKHCKKSTPDQPKAPH